LAVKAILTRSHIQTKLIDQFFDIHVIPSLLQMLKKDYSVVVKKHCVFPMFFSTTTYTNLPYFETYF
jgi:hypothetical protein